MDKIELEDRAYKRDFVDGEWKAECNMGLYSLIRTRQALTGNDKCSWELADEDGKLLPITEEIIDVIPQKYYIMIAAAVLNHDLTWDDEKNKADISKN